MPQPKENHELDAQQSKPGVDFTRILPTAVTQNELGNQLPNPDILSMCQTSTKLKGLFQPRVDALKLLKCVVEGDVDALMALTQNNPGLLFKKGMVEAPRGQTYYNVSPYLLMNFLCDEDMLKNIMPLIPNAYQQVRQAQYAELGHGGSDLVKLDFDPMSVTDDDFHKFIEFKTSIDVWGEPTDITFPLLENPDGLLYWKDNQGEVNFYYVNCETRTVTPLISEAITPKDQQALADFKHSFDAMEYNSARRSTNKEHQLIAKLMKYTLHRQGIRYSDAQGEQFCDSRTPFQLVNRYRTTIRLFNENQYERSYHYWRENVGKAQGEEMWLLQRICEENRPFYPLPQNFEAFRRTFAFINLRTNQVDEIFKEGQLNAGLGSDFALYKGNHQPRIVALRGALADTELNAVCRLVADAKAKTIEFELDQVLLENSGPRC